MAWSPESLAVEKEGSIQHMSHSSAAATLALMIHCPPTMVPHSHPYSATPRCHHQTTLMVLHTQHSPCCRDPQIPPSLPHRSQDGNPSSWCRSQPKPSTSLYPGPLSTPCTGIRRPAEPPPKSNWSFWAQSCNQPCPQPGNAMSEPYQEY